MDEKELIQRNWRVISEVIEELRKVYDELTPLPELITRAREPQTLRDALTEIVDRGAGMESIVWLQRRPLFLRGIDWWAT